MSSTQYQDLEESNKKSGGTGPVNSCWSVFCNALGLGCCIDEDKWEREPLAEVIQNKDRHCTDLPCCLFLLFVFVSEIILIWYAGDNGANPDYILHGYDYNGKLCKGSSGYTAWANLEADSKTEAFRIRVCLKKCSYTNDTSLVNDSITKTESVGIITPYPSDKFLNSWCLPENKWIKNQANATFSGFSSSSATMDRAISDLNVTKYLILISCFMAIIISFIYIKFISYLARCLIVLSLVLTFLGLGLAGYYFIHEGIKDTKNSETKKTGRWEIGVGVVIWVILFMFALALLWIRKRIKLALQMLNEASRAVRDMSSTVFFPILYSFVGIGFMAFWIAIALYIYSVKKKTTDDMPSWYSEYGDEYVRYEFDTDMKNAFIYHVLCLWYIFQVIIYFGYMVLAGTFADWYFSTWDTNHKKKKRGNDVAELSNAPICESFTRMLRYHLGSLAFGALVITIVRVLQAILLYIKAKTEKVENSLARCCLNCALCCLKCCECIINKINKEGFIFTTIYGTNFCYSSVIAVKLIWNNVVRAAMLESISHYMEIFGKITIASITTGICVLILNSYDYYQDEVSSILIPSIIIFIISYLIGSLFMMVFEVAVDTIFLCYLIDEQANKGAKFAHDSLTQMATVHRNSI